MPRDRSKDGPTTAAKSATGYQRLADELRQAILSGDIAPGERLPVESELGEQYNVGRSTVREALRLLLSERLVVTMRGVGGGTFVVDPEPDMISDWLKTALTLLAATERVTVEQLVAVREALELPATRAAALRSDHEHLQLLAANIFAPEQALEVGRGYRANRDFHVTILEASGNPLLAATAAPIFAVLRDRFLRDAAPPGFWDEVAADHRQILAAMQRRDADGAVHAMEEHLLKLRSTYVLIDTASISVARTTDGPRHS